MNKDFSKYQKIIDDFSGEVSNSDFESQYALVTKNIPKTERFLLKMELKRLAGACTRLVDLRGHVDGECKPFEHEGRVHFLDDVAKQVFESSSTKYGSYTFGVYEAVMNTENNFRVIYQKERRSPVSTNSAEKSKSLEKSQYPAKYIPFGPYYNRAEERMNFAITVQVAIAGESFEATTSDISVNGIKLRINSRQLEVGNLLTLRFTGLEEEFQFGKNSDFDYQVCNVRRFDNMLLVGAKRVYPLELQQDGFKQFLKGFIQGNKRRYKINLDNSISALQARSLEQFVLPKSSELPLFMQKMGDTLVPRYALTCQNNRKIYQYWQDERHYSTLSSLVNAERVNRLRKAALIGKNLVVYSFTHQNQGKTYFYSADNEQLVEDEVFMKLFLGFAASKSSFMITQLSLLDVDVSRAESHFTLSESLTKKNQYLSAPVPADVKVQLEQMPFIVVATNISHHDSVQTYRDFSFENIEMNKLRKFGHKRLSKASMIDEVGINYKNQRQELRFKYKTPVNIEIEGVNWQGTSHDFSTLGLKVELEKSSVLLKGDVVHVSFPALQKITSAFQLKNLPYEVMRVNKTKTVINLRVVVEKHQHIGRAFFKALIDKNKDKLTTDEYAMATPGLSKALRSIYSTSSVIPSLVVQTSGSRYKIDVVACGEQNSRLLSMMSQLSDRESFFNLYPILGHSQAMIKLTDSLKKMQSNDAEQTELLYIAINRRESAPEKKVTIKFASEIANIKVRQMFIRNALKKGEFFSVMVKLSRVLEPDMDYLNPELSYIGSYAIHRGKQIEQDIWSVAGLVKMIDTTQETLSRHQLSH